MTDLSRRSLCMIVVFISSISCLGQTGKWQAKWIGIPAAEKDTNLWTSYRKEFFISAAPKNARTKIATDSKYWLWVNGKIIVFEVELKKGPNPRDIYYVDIHLDNYVDNVLI